MKFRPCIDIHNGKVKQIVGSSLQDEGNAAKENFVSEYDGAAFARMYKDAGIQGGHIILLNPAGSEYYEEDCYQAELALTEYPGGLQIGGGINAENAGRFLDMGASHVIVTSYVFKNGEINYDNLEAIRRAVGKNHLVLDLSCRRCEDGYYIVTDRWQKFTKVKMTEGTLDMLAGYCDEYLIHAVDVEGKARGIEQDLVKNLGGYTGNPVTYAGGVHSMEDLLLLKELGRNRMNVTIGSALDLFGGSMKWKDVLKICSEEV